MIMVGCNLELHDEHYPMSLEHLMAPIIGIMRVKWPIWVLVLGSGLNVLMEKSVELHHLHCRFSFYSYTFAISPKFVESRDS